MTEVNRLEGNWRAAMRLQRQGVDVNAQLGVVPAQELAQSMDAKPGKPAGMPAIGSMPAPRPRAGR